MISRKITGYLYIAAGAFVAIYIAGQLLFQILATICGIILVLHGMRLVAPHQISFFSAQSFFQDRFRR